MRRVVFFAFIVSLTACTSIHIKKPRQMAQKIEIESSEQIRNIWLIGSKHSRNNFIEPISDFYHNGQRYFENDFIAEMTRGEGPVVHIYYWEDVQNRFAIKYKLKSAKNKINAEMSMLVPASCPPEFKKKDQLRLQNCYIVHRHKGQDQVRRLLLNNDQLFMTSLRSIYDFVLRWVVDNEDNQIITKSKKHRSAAAINDRVISDSFKLTPLERLVSHRSVLSLTEADYIKKFKNLYVKKQTLENFMKTKKLTFSSDNFGYFKSNFYLWSAYFAYRSFENVLKYCHVKSIHDMNLNYVDSHHTISNGDRGPKLVKYTNRRPLSTKYKAGTVSKEESYKFIHNQLKDTDFSRMLKECVRLKVSLY